MVDRRSGGSSSSEFTASGGWTGSGSGKGETKSVGLAMMEGAAMRLDSAGTMTGGGDEVATEAKLDGLAGIGIDNDKIGGSGLVIIGSLDELGLEGGV